MQAYRTVEKSSSSSATYWLGSPPQRSTWQRAARVGAHVRPPDCKRSAAALRLSDSRPKHPAICAAVVCMQQRPANPRPNSDAATPQLHTPQLHPLAPAQPSSACSPAPGAAAAAAGRPACPATAGCPPGPAPAQRAGRSGHPSQQSLPLHAMECMRRQWPMPEGERRLIRQLGDQAAAQGAPPACSPWGRHRLVHRSRRALRALHAVVCGTHSSSGTRAVQALTLVHRAGSALLALHAQLQVEGQAAAVHLLAGMVRGAAALPADQPCCSAACCCGGAAAPPRKD